MSNSKVKSYINLLEKYTGKKVVLLKENIEADKNQVIDYLQLALNNLDDLLGNLEKTTNLLSNYYELSETKKNLEGNIVVLENIQTDLNTNISDINNK